MMFGYQVVKITGDSMSPVIVDNAYLLIRHRHKYQIGDIVYVRHSYYGDIVKRIMSGNKHTGYYIAGDNIASVSMEKMGLVEHSNIVGVVRMIVNPPSSKVIA